MDGKLTVLTLGVLVSLTFGLPIPEPDNQDIVPGVFISADLLKDLQAKAEENQKKQNIQPITNQSKPVINLNENNLKTNPNVNTGTFPIESQSQESAPPVLSNQQTVTASEPVVITNQNLPQLPQPIGNQQQILQPVVANSRPLLVTQQPNQPTVWVQPNNQMVMQQSGNQLLLQQPNNQMFMQQPNNQLVVQQQPGNQYIVTQPGNQILLQQPNNQLYVQQKQPANNLGNIIIGQQPNNQLLVQQRGNQLLMQQASQPGNLIVNAQPNQQVVLQNGQIAQVVGQPTLITTNLPNNQISLLQTNRPMNNGQNANNVYTVVPINGPNNVQNTNASNRNTYLVPVQQMSNQMYAVNG